ncbi:MAG: hypothetical protein JWQ07_4835 [Ramlibacter sp.]|nr:hypothetical protein [Ramlibacter sp.]
MTTPNSTKQLRAGASSYADDARDATEHALESTRQFATQAFEKAGEKVRDLRYGAKDLASKGVSTVSDATAAAQKQLGQYAQATSRYVTEQPVKSALIAAAIGAAVAALVLALRRSNRDD